MFNMSKYVKIIWSFMGSIAGDFTGTAHEDSSEDKLETQLGMNQEFNHDLIPENTKTWFTSPSFRV